MGEITTTSISHTGSPPPVSSPLPEPRKPIVGKVVGIALLVGGSLLVCGGAVAIAAYVNAPFAQAMRLTAIHGTLLGRITMVGSLGVGTIALVIGGLRIHTGQPLSKPSQPPPSNPPPPSLPPIPSSRLPILPADGNSEIAGIIGAAGTGTSSGSEEPLSDEKVLECAFRQPFPSSAKPKVLFDGYRENIETQGQGMDFLVQALGLGQQAVDGDTALQTLLGDIYKALIPQAQALFWQRLVDTQMKALASRILKA